MLVQSSLEGRTSTRANRECVDFHSVPSLHPRHSLKSTRQRPNHSRLAWPSDESLADMSWCVYVCLFGSHAVSFLHQPKRKLPDTAACSFKPLVETQTCVAVCPSRLACRLPKSLVRQSRSRFPFTCPYHLANGSQARINQRSRLVWSSIGGRASLARGDYILTLTGTGAFTNPNA
mgnify:CR=1 FL=1